MLNKQETLSPELIAAVKDAIEATIGVNFAEFLSAYLEKNADQPELTEKDLVAEILEAGGYQAESNGFEDVVMIGAHAMGTDLELL